MVLELFLSMLATAHLLAAGLASVGPLSIALVRLAPHAQNNRVDRILRSMAWLSLVALVAAAALGLAAGYFRYALGDGAYGDMLQRFPSRFYYFTAIEWLFSLVCYGAWYKTWNWGRRHPRWQLLVVFIGATNLLYHFPPLMVLQRILVERPDIIASDAISRWQALEVIASGEILTQTFHFYALGIGFTSAVALWLSGDAPDGLIRRVAGWAGLAATFAQMITGVALVVLIPGSRAIGLLGGDLAPTLCLLGTIGFALGLVVTYAHAALRTYAIVPWRRPLYWTLSATFLMAMAARVSN
jgi:hypothetical protein